MGLQPIGRISPVAPSPSLVTSARALPNVEWRSGVAWLPACQPSYNYADCPDDDRLGPDGRVEADVPPFTIYTPLGCDLVMDPDDIDAAASELTDAHAAYGLARALWMGDGYHDTLTTTQGDAGVPVTLRNSAIGITATAVALDVAVASLIGEYELCTGGSGGAIVHVPSTLIPQALGSAGGGARIAWPEGNAYRGPCGITVSPGPGYPLGPTPHFGEGAGPDGAGNAFNESWIYITGPVEYAVAAATVLKPEEQRDRFTPRMNRYEVWAERRAIIRFDPCCVFAALVSNPAQLAVVS